MRCVRARRQLKNFFVFFFFFFQRPPLFSYPTGPKRRRRFGSKRDPGAQQHRAECGADPTWPPRALRPIFKRSTSDITIVVAPPFHLRSRHSSKIGILDIRWLGSNQNKGAKGRKRTRRGLFVYRSTLPATTPAKILLCLRKRQKNAMSMTTRH